MTVETWIKFATTGVMITAVAAAIVAQEKGGADETGPYNVVTNWPQPLHDDWTWGRTGGVWAASPDRVFVLQSGELPKLAAPIRRDGVPERPAAYAPNPRWEHVVLVFDAQGKLVESWDQHNKLFAHPHSVEMNPYDPERHVWMIDDQKEQIFKFTHDGKLVMTLGEAGVPGSDEKHFAGPTDVAFLPNGDFFVSDGYRNSRIVKFSKDGKFLMQFGKKGSGPGELNLPHGIAIDAQQRLYVADRANSRIQVFDSNGKYLDQWPNIRFPLTVAVSQDQHVWVSDGLTHKFLKFDTQGKLLYSWGTFGGQPGQIWGVHQFSVDSEGNLYTAEVWGGRAQKFQPKKGANPQHLIGPFYRSVAN